MNTSPSPLLPGPLYQGSFGYCVTCYAGHRGNCFTDPACVEGVTRQLLHLAEVHRFAVSAYCFMPDHVQFVAEAGSPESRLCVLMNVWKRRTGGMHQRSTGTKLWQNGYYDRALTRDDDRIVLIAGLLSSPLRAGVVSDLRRYRFWGSGVWNRDQLLDALGNLVPRGVHAAKGRDNGIVV